MVCAWCSWADVDPHMVMFDGSPTGLGFFLKRPRYTNAKRDGLPDGALPGHVEIRSAEQVKYRMNDVLGIDPTSTNDESVEAVQRDVDLAYEAEVAMEALENYPSTINDWTNNWTTTAHGECMDCSRSLTPNLIIQPEDGRWPLHVCTLCGNSIEHEEGKGETYFYGCSTHGMKQCYYCTHIRTYGVGFIEFLWRLDGAGVRRVLNFKGPGKVRQGGGNLLNRLGQIFESTCRRLPRQDSRTVYTASQ